VTVDPSDTMYMSWMGVRRKQEQDFKESLTSVEMPSYPVFWVYKNPEHMSV
jgi:hypothetical protein